MSEIRKEFTAEIRASGERSIVAIVSTESVDRDGDVIHASGWNLENYRKNPVVLFGHDYSRPPIARANSIDVVAGSLRATVEFPPKGISDLADEVHGLVRAGFLPGVSVGFRPLPGGKTFNATRGGMDFTSQELLEFSFVPIPSNPQALVVQRAKGDRTAMSRWLQRGDPYGTGSGSPTSPNPRVGPPTECPRSAAGNCPNDRQTIRCPAERDCPIAGPALASFAADRALARLVRHVDADEVFSGASPAEVTQAITVGTLAAVAGLIAEHVERSIAWHSGRVL